MQVHGIHQVLFLQLLKQFAQLYQGRHVFYDTQAALGRLPAYELHIFFGKEFLYLGTSGHTLPLAMNDRMKIITQVLHYRLHKYGDTGSEWLHYMYYLHNLKGVRCLYQALNSLLFTVSKSGYGMDISTHSLRMPIAASSLLLP
jgi:hypothetical protein